MDKICPTFIKFSWHEWKSTKLNLFLWILQVSLVKFSINLSNFYRNQLKIMKFNENSWNYTKLNEVSQNFLVNYFDFIQFQCISLTFAFGAFESCLQNFGLISTDSKFQNFGISNGESWKSKYHNYLILSVIMYSILLSVILLNVVTPMR